MTRIENVKHVCTSCKDVKIAFFCNELHTPATLVYSGTVLSINAYWRPRSRQPYLALFCHFINSVHTNFTYTAVH